MPQQPEDQFCVVCLLLFLIIIASVILLIKALQLIRIEILLRRQPASQETPMSMDMELVDLNSNGNKVVVNPDGEMMAAMATNTSPAES